MPGSSGMDTHPAEIETLSGNPLNGLKAKGDLGCAETQCRCNVQAEQMAVVRPKKRCPWLVGIHEKVDGPFQAAVPLK